MAVTEPRGRETRDVSPFGVALLALGIVAALGLAFFSMALLFERFAAREAAAQPPPVSLVSAERSPLPPEPRLQAAPARDLREVRTQEEARLTTYGWADRGASKARIPIERAIDVVAERGLPPKRRQP